MSLVLGDFERTLDERMEIDNFDKEGNFLSGTDGFRKLYEVDILGAGKWGETSVKWVIRLEPRPYLLRSRPIILTLYFPVDAFFSLASIQATLPLNRASMT